MCFVYIYIYIYIIFFRYLIYFDFSWKNFVIFSVLFYLFVKHYTLLFLVPLITDRILPVDKIYTLGNQRLCLLFQSYICIYCYS